MATGKKSRVKLGEGLELRGYLIRLYPTSEQAQMLRAIQLELMLAWNTLVLSRETHVEHCVRAAEDRGLVGEPPERPHENAPDEVWADYRQACGERTYAALQAMLPVEGYRWEDWRVDYKTLRNLFGGKDKETRSLGTAQMYTALVERFQRTKGAKLKRRPLEMPLQIKSGRLWTPESERSPEHFPGVGTRTNGTLRFAGMAIRGKWWREPTGEFIEGASVSLSAKGWQASLKERRSPRVMPTPQLGPVGVNLGLKYIAALSTGKVWLNPRGNEYTTRVARWQEQLDLETDGNRKVDLRMQLRRYQARFERKTRHLVLTEILPALADHDEIVVARGRDGLKGAAQGVQCRLSKNERGGYTSNMGELLELLRQRFGVRLREVDWSWISQQCSHCGHYDEKRYQRGALREKEGDYCRCSRPGCPSEGLLVHVDVNAARNCLGKPAISEAAAE